MARPQRNNILISVLCRSKLGCYRCLTAPSHRASDTMGQVITILLATLGLTGDGGKILSSPQPTLQFVAHVLDERQVRGKQLAMVKLQSAVADSSSWPHVGEHCLAALSCLVRLHRWRAVHGGVMMSSQYRKPARLPLMMTKVVRNVHESPSQTITLPPLIMSLCNTESSVKRSPWRLYTKPFPSLPCKQKLDIIRHSWTHLLTSQAWVLHLF